jgi:HK97 family phage prohead protease
MKLQHKSFGGTLLKAADSNEPEGVLEAIVSVFSNKDSGGDRVMPGFFSEWLMKRPPKGVWSHDWTQPVAKTLEAKELLPGDPLLPDSVKDLGGLYIKAAFNLGTQRGREAFSDLQFGTIDEFSIGYEIYEDRWDAKTKTRDLLRGRCFEWSPVLAGMNEMTVSLGTKDARPDAGTETKTEAGTAESTNPAVPSREARRVEAEKRRVDLTEKSVTAMAVVDGETKYALIGSYESLLDKLECAIEDCCDGNPFSYAWSYIIATFPDYVIAFICGTQGEGYWRFPYTVDADGNPTLGTPEQVEPTYVPMGNGGSSEAASQPTPMVEMSGRPVVTVDVKRFEALVSELKEVIAQLSGPTSSVPTSDPIAPNAEVPGSSPLAGAGDTDLTSAALKRRLKLVKTGFDLAVTSAAVH